MIRDIKRPIKSLLAVVAASVAVPCAAMADSGFMSPAAISSSTPVLYFTDAQSNAVYLIDARNINGPEIGKITSGINDPVALAVEPNGTLFVSNFGTGEVTAYALGQTRPFRTLRPVNGGISTVAVSRDGTLAIAYYVGGTGNGVVIIYDRGSQVPTRKIVFQPGTSVLVIMRAMAIDANDNVFVSVTRYPNGPSGVFEVPEGSTRPSLSSLGALTGAAFDGSGNFYGGWPNAIAVYAPGGLQPFRHINKGLVGASLLTVTHNGTLFVPNTQQYNGTPGSIVEYLSGASTPFAVRQTSDDKTTSAVTFKPAQL